MSESRPVCDCHGVEMVWDRDNRRTKGGYWRCAEQKRERQRKYRMTVKGRFAEHHRQVNRLMKKLAERKQRMT